MKGMRLPPIMADSLVRRDSEGWLYLTNRGRSMFSLWNNSRLAAAIECTEAMSVRNVKGELNIPPQERPSIWEQPKGFEGELYPHHTDALRWMTNRFDEGCGGVLLDEPGLGQKTEIFAFIAFLRNNRRSDSPVLIVCPAISVSSWVERAERGVPGIPIRVLTREVDPSTSDRQAAPPSVRGAEWAQFHIRIVSFEMSSALSTLFQSVLWSAVFVDCGASVLSLKRLTQSRAGLDLARVATIGGRFLLSKIQRRHGEEHVQHLRPTLDETVSLSHLLAPEVSSLLNNNCEKPQWHSDRFPAMLQRMILQRVINPTGPFPVPVPFPPDRVDLTVPVDLSRMQRFWYSSLVLEMHQQLFDGRVGTSCLSEILWVKKGMGGLPSQCRCHVCFFHCSPCTVRTVCLASFVCVCARERECVCVCVVPLHDICV